ncbi:MAG: LTA synthase family protein [Bacteroidales bacterium]|nr:LTA synthase family protein [Bacteroidales bacterium]
MSTIPNKSLIIENKVAFFIYSSYQYFTQTELDNLANEINNFIKKEYYNDHFLSNEYPLFRERVNNDVLSNYFEPFDQKPNLVFIIIESLGRNYSGPDALYGSFTPFLDSLAQHSLYWYNFLSTAGRTFGALPSIFASTPYGEMGFNELADSFPTHTSLLRNLKHNGYFISFFYGGWLGFDRMSDFLLYNKTDYLIKYFPPIYKKMGKDFSWGYDDRTLFNYSFKVIDSFPTSPRADIYLTLSNHNPWEYAEIEKYEKKLDQYFAQHPDLYSKQTDFFDKKRFATVLYTDDVLREFFKAYKKRPEFENTIFIITGDHGLSYNINLALKKFHVPLIIYSPKLKKSAVFKGVCSHSDISPSIELLLKNKTSFNIPQWTCYIGKGLDTSKFFNMNCSYAFIWENKTYPDILSNYYYMHKDSLFTVSDNFLQRNIKNPNIEKELKHKQTIIASMHKILPKQNKILPQHSFSTAYRLPLYPNYKNNPFVKYYKKNDNFIINKNQEFIDVCTAELKHNFFNTIIVNGFIQIQSQLLKKITTKLVFETRDSLNRLISWQSIDFEIKEKETKNFNIHKYLIISRTSSFLPIYKINVYFWNQERSILSIKKMNLDIYIE